MNTEEVTQYSLKYRPLYFRDVFGQDNIVKALIKRSKENNFPQAICFKGPFGTGKSTLAYITAAAMQCHTKDGEPDWDNPDNESILDQTFSRDVLLLDASRWSGKADMLEFTQQLNYKPMFSKSGIRVCIIEEADQASPAAMKSLLKILESTKPWNRFILCSMEEKGVPAAVLSRCQTFQVKPLKESDIMMGLKAVMEKTGEWQNTEIPNEFRLQGLKTIAMASKGSMRQAVQNLELCINNEAWTTDAIDDLLEVLDEAKMWQILDGLLVKTKDEKIWHTILHLKTGEEVMHFWNYATMMLSEAVIANRTGCVYDDSTRDRLERMGRNDESARLLNCLTLHPQMNKPYLRTSDLLACLTSYYDDVDFRPGFKSAPAVPAGEPKLRTVRETNPAEPAKIVIGNPDPKVAEKIIPPTRTINNNGNKIRQVVDLSNIDIAF